MTTRRSLPGPTRRQLCALLACAAGSGLALAEGRAVPIADEYQIKTDFVCKFGQYVEWPEQTFAQPDSPLVIGIVGPEAVAESLARHAAEIQVQGRAVSVRRLGANESLTGVHVLYVVGDGARADDVLQAARGRPILTVTEQGSRWDASHSTINFIVQDARVRFDVSLQAAEVGRLKISARLLTVARKVLGKPMQEVGLR